MTTLITHPLPVLAVGLALGRRIIPPRLLIAGLIFACVPDADVLAFKLGIAYADAFGHRGFSHSLLLLFAGYSPQSFSVDCNAGQPRQHCSSSSPPSATACWMH